MLSGDRWHLQLGFETVEEGAIQKGVGRAQVPAGVLRYHRKLPESQWTVVMTLTTVGGVG